MTEQERIIVSAYTGYLLCDFDKVHEYIEKKMGRPVWTHELASKEVWEEIRDRCREDFIALKEPEKRTEERAKTHARDLISRQEAIDALEEQLDYLQMLNKDENPTAESEWYGVNWARNTIADMPSAHPERKWIPCSNPPKHHRDVLVRGNEAIGNVVTHKVMQWDVDTWRPMDYAPSITWKEWSEIEI